MSFFVVSVPLLQTIFDSNQPFYSSPFADCPVTNEQRKHNAKRFVARSPLVARPNMLFPASKVIEKKIRFLQGARKPLILLQSNEWACRYQSVSCSPSTFQ